MLFSVFAVIMPMWRVGATKNRFYLDTQTSTLDVSAFLSIYLLILIPWQMFVPTIRYKIHDRMCFWFRTPLCLPRIWILVLPWLLSKSGHVLISAAQVYILTTTYVNRVSLCQPNDALLWHRTVTRVLQHTSTLCRRMLCTHHLHWTE